MRDYTYNFEIEDLVVQFIDAFNDVIIKRHNKDRNPEDQIHVNFVYSPKKRALYDILNKNPNPSNLPTIAVYINSLRRDESRVENKIGQSHYVNDSGSLKQRRQPVPINIEMGMSVITKSTQDMLQILSNWVPYTDPYIYIDVTDPSTNQSIRTKVKWTGSININQELDDPQATFRTGFDTSFTIEGYLYKKIIDDEGQICKITTNMSSVTSMNNCFLDIQSFETSIGLASSNKHTFVINGVPILKCIDPYYLVLGHEQYDFTITGKNLDFTENLFVSGTSGMFPTSAYQYYNYFPDTSAVSAINPCAEVPVTTTIITSSTCQPFSAIPISAFTVDNLGQKLQFTLPYNPSVFGVFDIIATSKCGCARLSLDSILNAINPYPPGTPEHDGYEPYQPPPAVNGGVVVVPIDFQNIIDRITALESLTSNYTSVANVVTSNSANWNLAYTSVTANSAIWAAGGGNVSVIIADTAPTSALSGNLWWDPSTGNGYIWYVDNDGGQWVSFTNMPGSEAYFTVISNSANWNISYSVLTANSANWNTSYTNLTANSANWINTTNTVSSNSANWNLAYTTITANSAAWGNSSNMPPSSVVQIMTSSLIAGENTTITPSSSGDNPIIIISSRSLDILQVSIFA